MAHGIHGNNKKWLTYRAKDLHCYAPTPRRQNTRHCSQTEELGEYGGGEEWEENVEEQEEDLMDWIRETGKDIAIQEFLPSEVDLPGSVQRIVGISLFVIRDSPSCSRDA
jgi:hypothetical protein